MKERRNKRQDFMPEEYKRSFMKEMAGNEEVTEYHRRMTNYDREDSFRQTSNVFSEKSAYDRQASHAQYIDNVTSENWRVKKKQSSEAKVKHVLAEI